MREAIWLAAISPILLLPLFRWGFLWNWWQSGETFLVAAGVCLFFGILALLAQELAFRRQQLVAGSLISILLRTVGVMLVAVGISWFWPEPASRELFPAFVACYLLTLAVETILSVMLIQRCDQKMEFQSES